MTIDKAVLRKLASEATAAIRLALGCGEPTPAEAFYAAARTAIPDLLDQLDRAEAECEHYRAQVSAVAAISNENLAQLSACRAALVEMTAARDEACDRLEAAWNRLYLKSEMADVGDGGTASLRSVGSK